MSYQPIALILGSDNKPSKMRLFDTLSTAIKDAWLFGARLQDIYKEVCGADASLSYAGEFPSVVDNHWVFYGRNRIPILDMWNNLLEDGVTLNKLGMCTFKVTDASQVLMYQDEGKLFSKGKTGFLKAIDAFGNTNYYPLETIFSLAKKDRDCTLFHNLDYSRLGTTPESLLKACCDDNAQIVIPMSGLSTDLEAV